MNTKNSGKKTEKTNVMRLLDEGNFTYEPFLYDPALLNAEDVARAAGRAPESVFKTLVTVGRSGAYYVFMLPANGMLDLKKAAKAAGEKAVEMIPQKQLLPLTGYIHGGCSPIGMKKSFPTFADETVILLDTVCFSAGRVGAQVILPVETFLQAVSPALCDLQKRE